LTEDAGGARLDAQDGGRSPRWGVSLVAAIAGFAVGSGLALLFSLLHSNWASIPGVTTEATSTVPYWVVQLLGPVLVSACWTALAFHARSVPRWKSLTAMALVVQVAILAVFLIPIAIAGNAGVWVGDYALPLLVLVALASPVIGAVRPRSQKASGPGWHVLAAAAFPTALWLSQWLWAPQIVPI
jgi:hypothetical protein